MSENLPDVGIELIDASNVDIARVAEDLLDKLLRGIEVRNLMTGPDAAFVVMEILLIVYDGLRDQGYDLKQRYMEGQQIVSWTIEPPPGLVM